MSFRSTLKTKGFPRIYNIIYWSWYYSDVSFDRHHLHRCRRHRTRCLSWLHSLFRSCSCNSLYLIPSIYMRLFFFFFCIKTEATNARKNEEIEHTAHTYFSMELHFIIWSMHVVFFFFGTFSKPNEIYLIHTRTIHTWDTFTLFCIYKLRYLEK